MAGEQETAVTLATEQPVDLDASTEVKEGPVGEAAAEGGEGEANEAGGNAGEEQPKKPSGAARAKIRETRLLNELAEANRKLEEVQRSTPARTASESEAKAPVEADFNGDWFAWQRALTAFDAGNEARKAIREEFQSKEISERQSRLTMENRQRVANFNDRVVELRETIPDLEATLSAAVANGNKPFSPFLMSEIGDHEKAVELSYFLLKNPARLEDLNDITDTRKLARAVGRLEVDVKLPTAKKATDAPPPLAPLKGGASGAFDPAKASMDDYVAQRKAGWRG